MWVGNSDRGGRAHLKGVEQRSMKWPTRQGRITKATDPQDCQLGQLSKLSYQPWSSPYDVSFAVSK
jgi:hypothetical protein